MKSSEERLAEMETRIQDLEQQLDLLRTSNEALLRERTALKATLKKFADVMLPNPNLK